jgi:hypothetical protein|nr:MAG: hypothetical protein KatS3mg041_2105 [Bacteroidota bacterium]
MRRTVHEAIESLTGLVLWASMALVVMLIGLLAWGGL